MARDDDGHVITSASSRGKSLDVEERQRRYAISMLVRTACFVAFLFAPGWWKIVALVGAAVIPAVAVVLANGEDHRPLPAVPDGDDDARLALPSGETIRGDVVEGDHGSG